MKTLQDFTGLYPVQKTLRFELKPHDETKKFLRISEDFLRAKYYPTLKAVLDDYYRFYIEKVLSVINLSEDIDFGKCFDLYNAVRREKTAQAKKEYKKSTDEICKKISEIFKDNFENYSLEKDGYSKLLKSDSKMFQWLNERLSFGEITQKEYDDRVEAIKAYIGYSTCLQGFNNNRKNMFEETGATSIAFRTVENMERYFDNCNNYLQITEKYPAIKTILADVDKFFMPENYYLFVAQSQVDEYNAVLGHSYEDVNAKGVNQKLNEYAQKSGLKRRDIPMMSVLYKQILSDRQTFVIEKIEKDEDLFALVTELGDKFTSIVKRVMDIVSENVNENTYVTRNMLTDMSLVLFDGDEPWARLGSAIRFYCEKNKINADKFKKVISLKDIQVAIDEYSDETGSVRIAVSDYFTRFSFEKILSALNRYDLIKGLNKLDDDRRAPSGDQKAGKGYEQVQTIKGLLDAFIDALRFYKPLYLVVEGKPEIPEDNNQAFYNQFVYEYESLSEIVPIYNKIRNYITTVSSIDKTKVRNFLGSSSLLSGWSVDRRNGDCYIFNHNGLYYLVEITDNKGIDFDELYKPDGNTWQARYFLQKLDSKNFPRVFICSEKFAKRAQGYADFDKVKYIYENKLYLKSAPIDEKEYKKNLIEMIDYFKYALPLHESYNMIDFSFKDSCEYQNIQEFYNDAIKFGYKIEKLPANFGYLTQLAIEHKVLLFQIYNKDFSEYSHGKANLHTMYFKALFSDENIERIAQGKPFVQLNGGAQIYTRQKSIDGKVTHKKNKPVGNKKPLNDKRESVFDYDLIKDRRFSEEKMFLHFPITLNSGTEAQREKAFNIAVNGYLFKNKDINIIGLDRGERHLLYYTVINRNGDILEQGTFNKVTSEYAGGTVTTDYRTLLDDKEKARALARKTWGKIEAIAPLKEGYLSVIVHKLAQLMIKYNAIIVLENLNKEMKKSRQKVEKQVYQKFEHALIDKLNYLVFKDKKDNEMGSVLNGYQFTNKLKQYEQIGKQNGFLFYIDPAYTSKICPKTGFVNLLRPEYTSVKNSAEFFSRFDGICYNSEEDYFEFSFDYDKFGDYAVLKRKKWTVCTFGTRFVYSVKEQGYCCVDITKRLKTLFEKRGLDYKAKDLKEKIVAITEKDFFVELIYLFKISLQIRNTTGGNADENDFILSPVKDAEGKFFDSRIAKDNEPKNADANGAYNIALKGLWTINHLTADGGLIDCTREGWLKFRQ